ncbi:MAG: hypothetical protein MI923_13535 [Phycisphaerales bacterium]|nr:hypothetical protein [Phycisphaerales bacterium]
MAEEEKQAEATTEETPAAGKPKKKPIATIGIFGGVMILEGLGIFFCMKFFGAEPDPTAGMDTNLTVTTAPFEESKEFKVASVRVQNTNGDRSILYSVGVSIRVHNDHEAMIEDFLKNRSATIDDAISRIIRSADERHLSEPGLETLKRQVRFELSTLLSDDTIIEQVLIPEFTPLPTGF